MMLEKILELGKNIAKENDYNKLFGIFLKGTTDIANCDAGTLYIYKERVEDGELKKYLCFASTINHTLKQYGGLEGEKLNLPPVIFSDTNASSYAGIHRVILNVDDVYKDDHSIWMGPRKYDSITGYHTQSVLVIPLIDKKDDLIGVLQLINCMDKDNNVIPFSKEIEKIIFSLSSQVAMILSNMLLTNDMEELLDSAINSLVNAIEAKTPFNALHTNTVTGLCDLFVDYLNKNSSEYKFSSDEKDVLHMAAQLHDVGKIGINDDILNKPTRLATRIDYIRSRFENLRLQLLVNKYEKNDPSMDNLVTELNSDLEFIENVNNAPFIDDAKMERINELCNKKVLGVKLLTDEEIEDLHIVKGTLTSKEREHIQEHVVKTVNILKDVKFGKKYHDSLIIAGQHHELLDGSGYPKRLKGDELNTQTRILTIMDIFDSLTASDRPYKATIPVEKAYGILCAMVNEGKLDPKLVGYLRGFIDELLAKYGNLDGKIAKTVLQIKKEEKELKEKEKF
ncbi:MAG: GAF domain-containing protein [Acholeplasmatales bacterium]|nr:GAF domain-containing protein [Acholeplasmatales bacterium]